MQYTTDYLVEIRDLHKYYNGQQILKGVDLNVKKGNLISIIGRSGCGKTTLLRCLNCLEILDHGSIKISGISLSRNQESVEEIIKISEIASKVRTNVSMPFNGYENIPSIDEDFQIKAFTIRKKVGMVFQSFNLFPHKTVLENVMLSQLVVKKDKEDTAKLKSVQLLEKVGMDMFLDRYPHQISGGQAQRVAIARALAMSPQVMLYDEPTSALDPELVDEVTEVMLNLNKEGMTQIVVTHSMNFARNASDLIVYMHEGKIVEIGPPEEIFNNAKDQRTRDYLKIFQD